MFSFYLSKSPEEPGSVTFGGYDLQQYAKKGSTDKDIFWSKIIPGEKSWTVSMTGAQLSGPAGMMELQPTKVQYAIVDTGMSYAFVPTEEFLRLVQIFESTYGIKCTQPPGEQTLTSTYQCQCDNFNQVPDIQIGLAWNTNEARQHPQYFTLPKSSYME